VAQPSSDQIEQRRDEIIAMALSDDVPFDVIESRFGLDEAALKRRMAEWLKAGSYRAWRKRVARFRDRHPRYKQR
jgi:uncharacterized protein (TIGR03643 family)